jgi:crotonobetainyl-CoA:carnitine CoA-transferase CaiB-like acyl-CoA transferase
MSNTVGALEGITVLELASGVGGPYCAKLLASLGASVIKVEQPGAGDVTRRTPPFVPAEDSLESSALFHNLNLGKQSISLDVDSPAGQELFQRLVTSWAQVVVTGEPYLALKARGLDWESLLAINPSLVVVAVSDFGMDGPARDYAGCELVDLALGGYLYLTGDPDREPVKPYGYQAEYHAGLHAAAGAVAAILRAELTGKGEVVDASVVEAASFLSSAAPGWSYFLGEDTHRVGNRNTSMDPKQMYPSTTRPCRDGWVHAHASRDREMLEVLIGDPELSRPDLLAEPKGHADEIDAIMDRWLATRDRNEIVQEAQALRLPFTEVLAPEEVVVDPHVMARGTLIELESPSIGRASYPHASIGLGASPWVTTRAPRLGEHTVAVLDQVLGLSAEQIQSLQRAGVI